MLLALPAAKAVDEFAFSTKGRVSMQVTVIRRFIQSNLVAPSAVLAWLTDLRKTMKK